MDFRTLGLTIAVAAATLVFPGASDAATFANSTQSWVLAAGGSASHLYGSTPLRTRVKPLTTSKQKTLYWTGNIDLPDGSGHTLMTRLTNVQVTIIEQISPQNNITTDYIASLTYWNHTEDDKDHTTSNWVINFENAQNVVLDSMAFSLPRDFCGTRQYSTNPPQVSPNNFFDLIDHATIQGSQTSRYQGAC